eukprot:1158705-Pelagomonas_calceolata.AAC.20
MAKPSDVLNLNFLTHDVNITFVRTTRSITWVCALWSCSRNGCPLERHKRQPAPVMPSVLKCTRTIKLSSLFSLCSSCSMSLFTTRTYWEAKSGSASEEYDGNCLCVANVDNDETGQVFVT